MKERSCGGCRQPRAQGLGKAEGTSDCKELVRFHLSHTSMHENTTLEIRKSVSSQEEKNVPRSNHLFYLEAFF